jgi:phosphoglycolate phosphatase
MREVRLSAVVFDFDGTLAELTIDFPEMKRRVAELAADYLHPLPEVGPPVLEWLEDVARAVAGNGGGHLELKARAMELIEAVEVEAASRGRAFEFSRRIFRDLRARSLPSAVITRNCRRAVQAVFPDLASLTGIVLTRDEATRVKPHPDHLLAALDEIGAAPETTLMVGDHPLDVETGKRAGTLTAGVSSGNASREELAAAGADFLAGNALELMGLIDSGGLLRAP